MSVPDARTSPAASDRDDLPQIERLKLNLGDGRQVNINQSGSNNHQINADTLHYHAAARNDEPPAPTHTIPYMRDDRFVERPELKKIEEKLAQPGKRIALHGIGGVGKSQLAIEYCYRVRERSPDTWVLWIHASSAARFDQDLHKLAEDVKIPGRHEAGADISTLVCGWLVDKRNSWLIVLDNADEVDFLVEPIQSPDTQTNSERQHSRLKRLPICSHGTMLFTSRSRAAALKLVDSHDLILLEPDTTHAIDILRVKLLRQTEEDEENFERLVVELDSMPLAIAQAAAYINRRAPRCSVLLYLDRLASSKRSMTTILTNTSKELRRDQQAHDSVLLTWHISFEHILTERASAANLLSLISFYGHQDIPECLITACYANPLHAHPDVYDDDESTNELLETDIDTLRDYSFISLSASVQTFEMHRLVQLAMQIWLQNKKTYNRWQSESFRKLDMLYPSITHDQQDIELAKSLYPHARTLLDDFEKIANPISRLQEFLPYGSSVRSIPSIYHKTASLELLMRWPLGNIHAKISYEYRLWLLGEHHEDTVSTFMLLSQAVSAQDEFETRSKLHTELLQQRVQTYEQQRSLTLKTLSVLISSLRHSSNHHQDEIELYRNTGSYTENNAKREALKTVLFDANRTTITLLSLGDDEDADVCAREILQITEQWLSLDAKLVMLWVQIIGSLNQDLDSAEVEFVVDQALKAYEQELASQEQATTKITSVLSMLERVPGRFQDAERLFRTIFEVHQKLLKVSDSLFTTEQATAARSADGVMDDGSASLR